MNPIFIDLGFIQIYWYSITMLLAILTGSFLFYKALKRKKVSDYHITNILFYAILFGILFLTNLTLCPKYDIIKV